MTAKACWVLPSIDPAWGQECLAGLRVAMVLRVDNAAPNINRGVAGSWNLGLRVARTVGADWLVVCSESMRFGPAGGLDFEAGLAGVLCRSQCVGFHLVGLRVDALTEVGGFDEGFFPAYYEDADLMHRLRLAGLLMTAADSPMVVVDCVEVAVAHSMQSGLVSVDYGGMLKRYVAKWGGPPNEERYAAPYDGRPPCG